MTATCSSALRARCICLATMPLLAGASKGRKANTSLWLRASVAFWFAAAAGSAWPQNGAVPVSYERGKLPVAVDAIGSLGADLLGDKVDIYNGSVSFEQTDIDLPGNNHLPVALVRSYSPRPWWGLRGAAADWDLNTPRIEGTFSELQGFVSANGGGPGARCSSYPLVTRDLWPVHRHVSYGTYGRLSF